jgi:hypothetical protein
MMIPLTCCRVPDSPNTLLDSAEQQHTQLAKAVVGVVQWRYNGTYLATHCLNFCYDTITQHAPHPTAMIGRARV